MCQVILVQKRASQMLAEFKKKKKEVQNLRLTASDVGVSPSVHIIL